MIFNVVLVFVACSISTSCASLVESYTWKYIDYVWKDAQQKSDAIDNNTYNLTMNIPYDVDRAPDGRIFVTVVKQSGVPVTLSTVSRKTGEGGPLLEPYPDWSWHNRKDCNGITGVYRVAIACNHLWVLDCGFSGAEQVCPAQLLVFDLSMDRLVERIRIPNEIATNSSGKGLLVTPVVDISHKRCNQIHMANVYMADTEGRGMVIWDGKKLYRIESEYFWPEERATLFTVANGSFYLEDGILGMAIERGVPNYRNRRLFFRPLASFSMSYTKIIDLNRLKFYPSRIAYHTESYELRSQSAAQAFSKSGILFYSSTSDESMLCWNRRKPFDADNNVQFAVDEEILQFASGVKVVTHRSGSEYLYVMTNRYQQFVNGALDFTDVNFRILTGNVNEIVKGTNCE